MQQTRTQSLVSRKMERARECGEREDSQRIMGSTFWASQFLALSLFFNYQATGYESGGTVGVGQSRKKGEKRITSANCMK